jgi:glycosyltransferase involved in cell wall biosynthesis
VIFITPMLEGARVVVVVPAFDEASRIGRVLRGMPAEVDAIVVVDDASRDGTARAAEGSEDTRVRVVSHAKNCGVGAAIATGYRIALGLTSRPNDAIVVMAGDGQMDPRDLPALVRPIALGDAEYAKGDRFSSRELRRTIPLARRLGGGVFSWLTSRAVGSRISDSQCGYTAISRAACASLDLSDLWPRYGYPNDLLGQLTTRHLRVADVPVRPIYAGEKSGLRAHHTPIIALLVARAWIRRLAGSIKGWPAR